MSLCCGSAFDEDAKNFPDLPYDSEIPVKNRKQTDLTFFILLVLYFIFLVICVIVAGAQGDIHRLFQNYDDKQNTCGYTNEPMEIVRKSDFNATEMKFHQIRKRCSCLPEMDCLKICRDINNRVLRRCISKAEKNKMITVKLVLEIVLSDLALCWKEITSLCFFSICLSGLMLTILRMFPMVAIKTIFVIVSVGSVIGTIATWAVYHTKAVALKNVLKQTKKNEMMKWLYFATFFTSSTVFIFALLWFLRNKMKLIAVFFEEGGKCIKNVPMMLLQPLLTYVISGVFLCFLCIGLACFETSGKAEIDEEGNIYFPVNPFFKVTFWLLLFAFLWISQFLLACQNLVIAGTVSSWYFSKVKGKLVNPVWQNFCMVVKYHLGSAAFGSLLIAIIKAIRFISKMFERNSRKNGLAVLIWLLVRCFLACIESFLQILNKTAYVMIVLFGEPFCTSARKAFNCIYTDVSYVTVVIGAGTFILAIVELLISCSVTFIGVALFSTKEGLQSFWIPTISVFFLSFLCCCCFFSVYDMTIDTLILCFCVDHQMNDGLERPYYMNDNFKALLKVGDGCLDETSPNENENRDNLQLVT